MVIFEFLHTCFKNPCIPCATNGPREECDEFLENVDVRGLTRDVKVRQVTSEVTNVFGGDPAQSWDACI